MLGISQWLSIFKAKNLTLNGELLVTCLHAPGKVVNKVLGRGHGKMRKWVKTMYLTESTYHREAFPPQREVKTTKSPASKI
jgi:hypothetical protein